MKMNVITESGIMPEYETEGSAGFDIRAFIDKPIIINTGQRCLVPTGLFLEVPAGFEAQVRARSGLAVKHGISLINGIGTIDSDYRGEIKIALINFGEDPFKIENGDRIAQVVVSPVERVELENADSLSETERGSGGFGHTGV